MVAAEPQLLPDASCWNYRWAKQSRWRGSGRVRAAPLQVRMALLQVLRDHKRRSKHAPGNLAFMPGTWPSHGFLRSPRSIMLRCPRASCLLS